MSGTVSGGMKAAATNMERYGKDYYAEIGRKGGIRGHTGGFAANRALARIAGAKGGSISRRDKAAEIDLENWVDEIRADLQKPDVSIRQLAMKYRCSDAAMKRFVARHGWLPEAYTPVENLEQD